jgi:hypothetical protein
LYDSDPYKQARRKREHAYQARVRQMFTDFETRVSGKGFRIVQVQMGPTTSTEMVPLVDGEPCSSTTCDRKPPASRRRCGACGGSKRRTPS